MLVHKIFSLCGWIVVCLVLSLTSAAADTPQAETPVREVQLAVDAFSRAPAPNWVEPIDLPAANGKQPVVNRLIDVQYMVGEKPSAYFRQALEINDASSLTSAGQVSITFVPQYQHLSLHTVSVRRGSQVIDQTASSPVRFLQRETGLEQGVYSDVVTASILVSDLRVGDTLETAYTIEGKNPVFGKHYFDYSSWDRPEPTVRRRVILKNPADRKIEWRFVTSKKNDVLSPQVTTADGLRRLEFNGTDIPAVIGETLTPSDANPYRWLEFSEFSDWGAVASWASELFVATDANSSEFKAAVEAINAKSTPQERTVAALELVQSQVRYFSVSLGESSHKPTQPDAVLQRRFGDCKDKALLLVSLLKQAGIKSNPVLLSVSRRKGLDTSLPSPIDFDHAIVQAVLGGKSYYLDPTRLGQHGQIDRLGKVFQSAQVLVISTETKGLTQIPAASAPFDRDDLVETAKLSKLDGEGELEVRHTWSGVNAELMRVLREQIPADTLRKSYFDAMTKRFPAATLKGDPQFTDDRTNNVLTVTTNYAVPGMATERSGNWLIPLSASNFKGTLAPISPTTRTAPLSIPGHPFSGTYSFKVTLPEVFNIWETPFAGNVQDKHFTADTVTKYRGNIVKAMMTLQTRAERIEPADLKSYNESVQSLAKLPSAAIVIPAKLAKVAQAKSKSPQAAAAVPSSKLEARLREEIKNAGEAIASGKLAPPDAAQAYILKANAEGDLGDVENAVSDAMKAVELANGDRASLWARADSYYTARDFAKSIADYSAALALGGDAGKIYRSRGIANYYAGKLEDAAADFAKSSSLLNGEEQTYSDIWVVLTSRRLGRDVPSEVAARATAGLQLEWPGPGLALLTGSASEADIVRIMQAKSGMEKVTVSTEGYFYLGLAKLLANEKDKAREYFTNAVASKGYGYEEHKAAQFELKDLLGATATSSIDAKAEVPAAAKSEAKVPPSVQAAKAPVTVKKDRAGAARAKREADDVFSRRPFQ